jgi:hypothetical protein
VVSATDPPAVNSVFLTGAATFSFKWLLNYPHEAEYSVLLRKSGSAGVSNPGPLDL